MYETPRILEWQVLPFSMTSSPHCATYAMQRNVQQHRLTAEAIQLSVENCFYVNNFLQSLPTTDAAQNLIDRLRNILSGAGFDICQWACTDPESTLADGHLVLQAPNRGVQYSHLEECIYKSQLLSVTHEDGFYLTAKVIIKQLWNKQRGWDDRNLPPELLQA